MPELSILAVEDASQGLLRTQQHKAVIVKLNPSAEFGQLIDSLPVSLHLGKHRYVQQLAMRAQIYYCEFLGDRVTDILHREPV